MKKHYDRREFLRRAASASLVGGAAALGWSATGRSARAACSGIVMPRALVNLMLYGGIDSRFVFMPAPSHPDADYLAKLWSARSGLYPTAYPDYASMFAAEYLLTTDAGSGQQFGIFKDCGWLKSQFDSGRVAVVANSFGSENRRHDQSQLNANIGEPGYSQLLYSRDGWGGRLAEQCGTDATTVELAHEISVFGQGTDSTDRLKQVVHADDTRDIALPEVDPATSPTTRRNILARALKSYYAGRGNEVRNSIGAPFSIYYQHETALRDLGVRVSTRLEECGPLPPELTGLALNSHHFAQQCRNLYDVVQAPEAFDVRTISMRYDGWDTHNNQYSRITRNLADVFGAGGGLDTTLAQIDLLTGPAPLPREQITFVVSSDFGRQLIANGDVGTDHGQGLYTILIGHQVNGGIYGDMFPERESTPDEQGRIPLEHSGSDIEGLTSTERVLAEACEWMQAGSSAAVFPNAAAAPIESPGLLDNLFSA